MITLVLVSILKPTDYLGYKKKKKYKNIIEYTKKLCYYFEKENLNYYESKTNYKNC